MSNDLTLVENSIAILEKANWIAYGDHQSADYLTYMQGQHGDELSLMDGLLGEFLEQVLGFTLHRDLLPQMTSKTTGKRPDYIPDDTHLHPFVFDAKGTDTTDLGQHYDQIARYMCAKGLRYGVLSNMRDLAVYTLQSDQPEAGFSFSFRQLYQDYQQDPTAVLQIQNTKRFLDFAHRFRRRKLDQAGKVQAIIDARHGPQDAQLNLDELVRCLHNVVAVLHDDVRLRRGNLLQLLRYDNERKERIALEIDAIVHEIDSGAPERKVKAATLKKLLVADADTTDGRAADRYFYRVAYFAMTRIMLARVWEDIGFIKQTLYDGGFEHWYEYYNAEIQRVLNQAFHFAKERYTWLYGADNNYTWYTPSEAVLVDVLYDFSHFDFQALDADVLGAVYEAYLDKTDRKNKGQYYTPRPVVQFIWDRVGFDAPDRIFRFAGGKREPRVVTDFCTGSGGFLVEAARRIREAVLGSNFDLSNPTSLENVSLDDLVLAMNAIIEGLRGTEINAFAYYLTEVNLLIQLTPIIAAIQEKSPHAPYFGRDFALAVIHQDALKLHNRRQRSLIAADGEMVSDFTQKDEMYEQDRRYDIVNLSGFKRTVYAWLKDEREVDYICSNPPYVGEKGHKELFRYYRNNFDYWDEHYQGKMDYLYWFIILGLSKLREGGRLGFITTSYWPTADGAKTLRRYILDHAKIVEMVDFGDTRIFSDAPGQHNMVFVLERCDDAEARAANRPRLVRVKREFERETIEKRLSRLLDHIRKHIDIAAGESFEDDYIASFWSPTTQLDLSDKRWHILYGGSVDCILSRIDIAGPELELLCNANEGVKTSANQVTSGIARHLSNADIELGQGIFVITRAELDRMNLSESEKDHIKPAFVGADIDRYTLLPDEEIYLIYADSEFDIHSNPGIKRHLEKFMPALLKREETDRFPWYALLRPRDKSIFENEKIITSYRSYHNCFAYDNDGLYSVTGIYFITKHRDVLEELRYILALLDSSVLDFWMHWRSRRKGDIREYTSSTLNPIPIRRIRFNPPTNDAVRQAALDALKNYLGDEAYDAAYNTLHQALKGGQEDVVHDGLVEIVDQIITLQTELTSYNRHFGTRLTRLEDSAPLPEIKPLTVLQGMVAAEQWSVEIHIQNGALTVDENVGGKRDDFYFYRVKKTANDSITLRAKGQGADTLTLKGDSALIDYLKTVLPVQQEQFWRAVKKTLVPKDMMAYESKNQCITQKVIMIRDQVAGRQLIIDQIVLDLYGITEPEDRNTVLSKAAT